MGRATQTQLETPDGSHRLLWLIGIRLLVITSVVVSFLLYYPDRASDPTLGFFIAYVSIQTLVYTALLKLLRRWPIAQAYIQFVGDLVLITLLVYKLDAGATFSILYVLIISVAAIFLSRTGVLVIAGLAYLAYVSVILHWIRLLADWRAPLPPLPSEPLATLQLFYNLVVHLIGFYGVAILTSYLVRSAARTEEKLRVQQMDLAYLQGLYGDVIESMSGGLAITDLDSKILSVNAAGERILRRSERELIGRPIAASGMFSEAVWRRYLDDSGGITVRSEGPCRRGDGTMTHVGYTLTHLRDAGGVHRGYILLFQDLSQWRALQEQVQTQDRMAAIGQMAAGLAHEVGNPLAAISGAVQMLERSLQGDDAEAKLLRIVLKESRRLDRTVKAFLQFARPRERQLAEIDVAALLAEDVELLRASDEVGPRHVIETDLEPPSAVIRADVDQVGQLFWNLARNALKAMPDGGKLAISGRLENGCYRIRFRDTGSGMTEEERAKIFHPFKSFFDGGTGLGMAIVYRIVEEHGGEIRVDSEPRRGSTITVDLPVEPPEPSYPQEGEEKP